MTQIAIDPEESPPAPQVESERNPGARRVPGQMLLERLAETTATKRSWLQRLLGSSPLSADDWPWYQGALGEEFVGRELDRLPAGWHVFHSMPIGAGSSDVDHVIVGPPGVFTINTKHHKGARVWVRGTSVTVNGRREQYVRAVQHEAHSVARMLVGPDGVPVTAYLAVVGADRMDVSGLPDGVEIVHARGLVRSLIRRSEVLSAKEVESVRQRIEEWSATAPPPSPEILRHWAGLKRGHREARAIARMWRLATIAVVVGAAVRFGPDAIASAFAFIGGLSG
jgi:hypothetical protein